MKIYRPSAHMQRAYFIYFINGVFPFCIYTELLFYLDDIVGMRPKYLDIYSCLHLFLYTRYDRQTRTTKKTYTENVYDLV